MSLAVCEGGCQMGGTCIAPDTCFCAQGYLGKNCEIGKLNLPTTQSVTVIMHFILCKAVYQDFGFLIANSGFLLASLAG